VSPRASLPVLDADCRNDTSSSIFVHPPTPERDGTLPSLDAAGVAMTSAKTVPTVLIPSPPGGSKSVPLPLQVLPEVRSPPRRTIAMAADSLQLTQRRGRRPRLFGFTEMNDGSGSSAGSSAANSRQTSPERPASPALPTSPAPGPDFIPRRTPLRARSETDLLTVGATRASAPTITHPSPRRKENGLKLDFTGIVPIANPIESQSCIVPSPYSARLIRKKSGEILKPALKYGGPLAPNGTPLGGPRTDISPDSPASARFESKSCPTTPSCPKYVHFNPQLEQVKLFLHDQKPQVVSRSGSPSEHYTTSEGEEYPFPSTDEERDEKKVLQIKLPNFPTSHMPDTDLYLESLFLDDDRKNLRGMILCKNYSYHKWVAVRFTFDFWQTTSEVTATFKDSVKGGKYDRFSFTIKLHDLMPRIEEKTMFLATRYTTDGREIWDSNGGQNYQVLFEKVRPAAVTTVPKRNSVSIQPGMGQAVGGRTSQWSVTGGNADDRLADLRAKLSRLSADDATSSPPQLSPNRTTFAFSPNRRGSSLAKGPSSPSGSPARTLSALDARTSDLPSAGPALAARYDFGNALKTTRRSSPNSQKTELPEVQTGLLNYGSRVNHGHAATEFYSPRFSPRPLPDATMQSTDMLFSPPLPVEYPVSPTTITGLVPSPLAVPNLHVQAPSPSPTEEVPTPTAAMSSPKRPALGRSRTTPAVLSSPRDSPPSLDTPTGSLTDTASESPRSPPDMTLPKWSPTGSSSEKSDMSLASYSSFIEQ